jgi:hypothetical protein
LQVEVARDFIASHEAAVAKDITMVEGDWLSHEVLKEQFDLGYDYTYASDNTATSLHLPRCIQFHQTIIHQIVSQRIAATPGMHSPHPGCLKLCTLFVLAEQHR